MIGVIPSAGKGTRAYPYTKGIPKGMLEVAGQPNLERVIRIMRDQLQIVDIVIIVGNFGHVIREYFGDGSRCGVRLTYVENTEVDKGLSHSILLARPHVREHFCVMLADECYVETNHHELLTTAYRSAVATCAVMSANSPERLRENYAVSVADGRICSIVEKPAEPAEGALLGVGTWVFSPEIFTHLEAALAAPEQSPRDPVSVLGQLCARGVPIMPFYLDGAYVNINSRDQLNLANNLIRSLNFDARTLALVLLAKGPCDDTRRVVDEFRALGRFTQIIVVTPPGGQAPAGVDHVRAATAAHGAMMAAGLDHASADILFTVLADGSFAPADVPKFLEYLKDADLVVGTRTTRQMVHQGTNMRGIVRLAHVVLGRMIELTWWGYEPRFTDAGCAYRALWASSYRLIRPRLRTVGPEFFVAMVLETLQCRRRVIEIPVNFRVPRPGLRDDEQTLATFWSIAWCILARRFRSAEPAL